MSELQKLFNNEIPNIIVDGFLSSAQINDFLSALNQREDWNNSLQNKTLFNTIPARYLFSSQYTFMAKGINEDEYLAECLQYAAVWEDIVNASGFDPFHLLVQHLLPNHIEIASKEQRLYCPAVFRDLHFDILPHADFAPFDGPNWAIDKVQKQIAWNIYFTDPVSGGETIIYDHFWENTEEVAENSYGIETVYPEKARFTVKPGRLVLFNSRNLHAVTASQNERIAIGGLIGQTSENKIIAWS